MFNGFPPKPGGVVQSVGVDLPVEGKLNFGLAFTVADDPVNRVTKVDLIPTSGFFSNLVEQKAVAANCASVTFSGLDSTQDGDYILECDIAASSAGAGSYLCLFANGDTATGNYYSTYTMNGSPGNRVDQAFISLNVSQPTIARIAVSVVGGKIVAQSQYNRCASGGNPSIGLGAVEYKNTVTGITSLTISDSSGTLSIGVGSVFRLYKTNLVPQMVLTSKYFTNVVDSRVIAADCTSVLFAGLDSLQDGDYTLELSIVGKSNNNTVLYVNGDTTDAHYKCERFYATTNGNTCASSVMTGPVISDSGVGENHAATISIKVVNGYVLMRSVAIGLSPAGNAYVMDFAAATTWTVTSITSLQVAVDGGGNGIGAGSRFTLYKANSAQQLVAATVTDITGRVSDYPLKAGETVSITYTGATSVPLNVATSEGVYSLEITGDISVATVNGNAITLAPNNAAQTGFIAAQNQIGLNNQAGQVIAGIATAIQIGNSTLANASYTLYTTTKAKSFAGRATYKFHSNQYYYCDTFTGVWPNTTTAWTSLGTITFPFAQSGKVIVRRIA